MTDCLPIDKFFDIPELPHKVFELLNCDYRNKKYHFANALVSKKWSELALDFLWREVTNLRHLFEILAPMQKSQKTGRYEFIKMPSIAQWQYFEKYRHRVRSITAHDGGQPIGRSAFNAIARTRTNLIIFPNLHTLHWFDGVDFDVCVIFMHSRVNTLTTIFNAESQLPMGRDVLPEVIKMSNITHFNFHMPYKITTFDVEAGGILSSLHNLEELETHPYQFSSTLVQTLSRLPNLRAITHGSMHVDDPELHLDHSLLPEDLALEQGAFPKLEKLAIWASFSDGLRFVKAANGPENLKSFEINSQRLETPQKYKTLITAIITHYSNITSIELMCYRHWQRLGSLPDGYPETHPPLTIDTLEPLFALPGLRSLSISFWGTQTFLDEDLEKIARAFPSLQVLNLCPNLMSTTPSSLTLSSILHFAHHCPNIRQLYLPLEARGMTINQHLAEFQRAPRMKLDLIYFGSLRPVGEAEVVAFLLSWVLHPGCEFIHFAGTMDWSKKVESLLNLFLKAQRGGRLLE